MAELMKKNMCVKDNTIEPVGVGGSLHLDSNVNARKLGNPHMHNAPPTALRWGHIYHSSKIYALPGGVS